MDIRYPSCFTRVLLRVIPTLTRYSGIVSDISPLSLCIHIFWQSIGHSIWHPLWLILWHTFWHLFKHVLWHPSYLASFLAFIQVSYLAYIVLVFYLESRLTFYLVQAVPTASGPAFVKNLETLSPGRWEATLIECALLRWPCILEMWSSWFYSSTDGLPTYLTQLAWMRFWLSL